MPREDPLGSDVDETLAHNLATFEVGYVQNPPVSINSSDGSFKVSFTENQKDRVVPMDSPQTGKMK